jgi:hypothetical protein
MAGPKRSPLDFGFGERSFVQRFVLAEILGPPRSRGRAQAAPRAPDAAADDDPSGAPAAAAPRSSSGEPPRTR